VAEPARKASENIEPTIRPNLKALEGGNETSEPKRGHLRVADGDDKKSALTPEQIQSQERVAGGGNEPVTEAAPPSDQVGRGFKAGTKSRFSRLKILLRRTRFCLVLLQALACFSSA